MTKSGSVYLKFAIAATLLCGFSCKEEPKSSSNGSNTTEVSFTKEGELSLKDQETDSLIAALDIEIADNDYEIQTGLMYRSKMERKQGMLFIFEDEANRSFYMKNTKIPLDIIFINADKEIVSIQKNAAPFDEVGLPSEGPAQYVLEINGGLSDEWQLQQGDIIEYKVLK